MLQYTHGSLNIQPMHNGGNLFVHRLVNHCSESNKDIILSSYASAISGSANTYWKSPNSVETSSFPKHGLCIPPEMHVSSKFSHRPKVATVKGILKNKPDSNTSDREMKLDVNEMTPRSSYQRLNETVAGSSATKLSGSSTKRVQFDGLPKHQDTPNETEKKSKHVPKSGVAETQNTAKVEKPEVNKLKTELSKTVKSASEVKRVPLEGAYTFRRDNTARRLTRSFTQSSNEPKSQISDFIKKLRLVESAKLKRAEENIKHVEQLEKGIEKSSERLRRPRIKSAMFRSAENAQSNDRQNSSERAKSASLEFRNSGKSTGEKTVYFNNTLKLKRDDTKYAVSDTSKDLLPANSFLLNQADGSGGLDKSKRQNAFSAYTRHNAYRPPYLKLWKPSESNCYKDDGKKKNLSNSKQTQVTNYCDSGKTSQILGWLYDVTTARSEDADLNCVTPSLTNEDINNIEDDYIPSID